MQLPSTRFVSLRGAGFFVPLLQSTLVRALNSSYSYSAERYSYSYSKSQQMRIVLMLTRLIQRIARNADHPIDYEYEYRDAEYE